MAEFIRDGTEYDIELAKDDVPTLVKIGGITEKFLPNINASKWNDECWLNINHPDIVTTEKETFVDDKAEIEIGNNVHRYYVDVEGKLEYEIVLKTIPTSNKIELDLDFPEGLKFYYQPSLQEEYDSGKTRGATSFEEFIASHNRPENVVGSYAVYWNRKNNKYKTGKFCHIYRPQVFDAVGKSIWALLNISSNKMTIEIDSKWLKKATYPVTIDPAFGLETKGATGSEHQADQKNGTSYPMDAVNGTIDDYQVYCDGNGSDTLKVGCYETDGSDSPEGQSLVEQGSSIPTAVEGWQTVAGSGGSLTASAEYHLCWSQADVNIYIWYDASGPGFEAWHTPITIGDEMLATYQDPATGTDAGGWQWSIFVNYTEVGGTAHSLVSSVALSSAINGISYANRSLRGTI